MKKLILFLSLCISPFVLAADSTASIVVKEWLKIVDSGEYVESWEKSDPLFKLQLSQSKWDAALTGVRTPLGAVKSRSEIGIEEYSSLPGAPDGLYMVIQFQTEFQNKESATETLTLSKSSGQWLPVGYFIK